MEELMGYELEENTFNCPYFTVCYEQIYSTENPKHIYPPLPPYAHHRELETYYLTF